VASRSGTLRFQRDLLAWGERNRRVFGWRTTDDPFRVLIAEVLLQRSRGSTATGVFDELFRRWEDPASLADASVEEITATIRPLGLVRRGASLKALAREIDARGSVPSTYDELVALPGVGPYAANATLAVAFGERAPVVDGVTARVYRRYFGLDAEAPASTDAELWQLVGRVTPRTQVREWNWAVLDLAALICLPKRPRCGECPLQPHCAWSRARATVS
jgi:A/G-specific adenine glycosylase